METMDQVREHAPTGRVSDHTSAAANREIRQDIVRRVEALARNPAGIDRRLGKLQDEWDVERMLETNASTLVLTGLALGHLVDRRWYLLSGTVAAFLLQHGIQGWCPPLYVLRKLGYRTRQEIDWERTALKAVRGDFAELSEIDDPGERARAALTSAGD
ncbi:DUF2892 domain-containing protein [Lewinella sp. JB7]|uniref:DUF2892 domain-containing protein n=1 Tax=Lewinella sp. JB7 TaxID=2962887 RepID=UPI0020C954F1|nr:DUF2892 domain-containing protein [Lewinella sp. JB7]MCP9235813.1 DUF2892 domain-containing protein [Lewinella sp. JB7]